jgi:hypothetical protein
MTEEEAKKTWCPHARQLVEINTVGPDAVGPVALASANRFKGNEMSTCLASSCMSWRWTMPIPLPNYILIRKGVEEPNDPARWVLVENPPEEKNLRPAQLELWMAEVGSKIYRNVSPPRAGFCGLAGRPV